MSSRARYVSGDAKPRIYRASATHPFQKGDLLYLHPADHTLRRATDMNAQGSAKTGQLGFAQYFVGVAGVKNGLETGETTFKQNANFEEEVLVFTGGVWEFDCPSQEWETGDGVGIYATSLGVCDNNQKVDSLQGGATLSARIGVAACGAGQVKADGVMTRVNVEIQPAAAAGGIPSAGTYTGSSGQ